MLNWRKWCVATTDCIPAFGSQLEFCDCPWFSPFSDCWMPQLHGINTAVLFLFSYVCISVTNDDTHPFLFNSQWKLWDENPLDWMKRKSTKMTGYLCPCQMGKWYGVIFQQEWQNWLKLWLPFAYDFLWMKAQIINRATRTRDPSSSTTSRFLRELHIPVRLSIHLLCPGQSRFVHWPRVIGIAPPLLPKVSRFGDELCSHTPHAGCWAGNLGIQTPLPSPTARPGPGDMHQVPVHDTGWT